MARRHGMVTTFVGGFTLIVSLVMLIAFPVLYKKELERETTLVNNTVLYGLWKDLPIPIYLKLYFFNITNGNDFKQFGFPLEVEEVGPYTYRSKWVKEEIEWDNGTVSYRERKTFFFDQENSVGSEDDTVYSLNGPLIFAISYVKDRNSKVQKFANLLFKLFGEKLIVNKTVGELSFGGYSDLIIKYGKYLEHMPFESGKFSWLYGKNDTDDGLFSVYTGEYNHSKLNIIKEWNGSPETPFWEKGSRCNAIEGTNAEVGPPVKEKQSNYSFFQPLLCRSMTFDYAGKISHRGILTKRFKSTSKILANSEDNPENACFHQTLPSGVLNISSCQFGAPAMLSFPHFYFANESYFENIIGLDPNETQHGSFIDIEPMTGVSLALAVRFQVNVFLEQNHLFQEVQKVQSGVYPIFWLEMVTEIDDKLSRMMYDQLKKPKQYAYSILGLLSGLSACLLVSGLYLMHQKKDLESEEERKPLLERDEICNYGGVKGAADGNVSVPDGNLNLPSGNEQDKATDQSKLFKQCEVPPKRTTSLGNSNKTHSSGTATEKKKMGTFFDRTTVP